MVDQEADKVSRRSAVDHHFKDFESVDRRPNKKLAIVTENL